MINKLCLIEAQNLWYTPKNNWNMKVDYKKLFRFLNRNPLERVYPNIYLIFDPLISGDKFIYLLKKTGYKPLVKFIFQSESEEFDNTEWAGDMIKEIGRAHV